MAEMITYIRPSGSTIELANTPNMEKLAKNNGWERKQKKRGPKPKNQTAEE